MRANFDDELNPNVITKKFWSSFKSTSKSSRIPEKMHLGNTVRNNSEEIANLFNKHFYNQFSDSSTYEIDIDFSNDLFSDFSIDDRIICNALRELNPNKSKGPDNIGGLLLKNCAQSISYPLSILFNISFRTGSLPIEWKMANIVPVYKKGDKNFIENYRPISLTCIVSKIFEKCIRDELLSHCKELIHDTQHGFIPNKSCVTQLLPFSHDISLGLNSGESIDVVYFDFAKAFDSVNHGIILHKLKYQFGIDGHMLKFIKEYLKGRKQRVLVNRKLSTILDVKSGVPQGYILGPLLFVLFINDIHTKISENTQIMLYADDTKIWRHILAPIDHEILQRDIDSLNAWATLNKMKFHPEKCKILSINNFKYNILQELPFYLYAYELDNTVLDYVNEEKDLGLLMKSKFTYKAHQEYIIKKATVQFNLLRRTCHYVHNTKKRRTLYLTLVRSIFNHCSHIWKPIDSAVLPFEALQKRCIKWIFKESYMPYNDREYISKLQELEILPIDYYFLKIDLQLFYNIIHELVPIKLPEDIIECNPRTRSRHNTQYLFQLHERLSNKKRTLSNSFFVRTMSQWNRLPFEVRKISEFNNFKAALDDYFMKILSNDIEIFSESDREPDLIIVTFL